MSKKMTLEEFYQWKTDGHYEGQGFWNAIPSKMEFENAYVETRKSLDKAQILQGYTLQMISEMSEVSQGDVMALVMQHIVRTYVELFDNVKEDKKEELIKEILIEFAENKVPVVDYPEALIALYKSM